MRRPLFGNGFPAALPFLASPTGALKIFDALNFTPQNKAPQAFAVTLYLWHWSVVTPLADLTLLPRVAVISTSGNSLTDAARLATLFFIEDEQIAAIQAAQKNEMALPIKVLDRFVVRGDQQIYAYNVNQSVGATQAIVYGYFEAVGETVPSLPLRGLQPSDNLVPPYSYPPVHFFTQLNDNRDLRPLHQLNPDYIDLVDIIGNVGWFPGDTGPTPPVAGLSFDDGNAFPFPAYSAHYLLSRPFPYYQPFIDDNLISGGFFDTNNLGAAPGAIFFTGYGSFTRH